VYGQCARNAHSRAQATASMSADNNNPVLGFAVSSIRPMCGRNLFGGFQQMRCSKCGTDNAGDMRFCNQCACRSTGLVRKCAYENGPRQSSAGAVCPHSCRADRLIDNRPSARAPSVDSIRITFVSSYEKPPCPARFPVLPVVNEVDVARDDNVRGATIFVVLLVALPAFQKNLLTQPQPRRNSPTHQTSPAPSVWVDISRDYK
jgi:hypothetical protein